MVNLMVSFEPLNFVCQGLWFGVEPKNLEQPSDSKVWVEAWEEKPSAEAGLQILASQSLCHKTSEDHPGIRVQVSDSEKGFSELPSSSDICESDWGHPQST